LSKRRQPCRSSEHLWLLTEVHFAPLPLVQKAALAALISLAGPRNETDEHGRDGEAMLTETFRVLAQRVGLSNPTFKRCIRAFVDAGFVRLRAARLPGGPFGRRAYAYYLSLPAIERLLRQSGDPVPEDNKRLLAEFRTRDGKLAADVFAAFARNETLPAIVQTHKLAPELVRRLWDEYTTPLEPQQTEEAGDGTADLERLERRLQRRRSMHQRSMRTAFESFGLESLAHKA